MKFFDYKDTVHMGGIPIGESVQKAVKNIRTLEQMKFANELQQGSPENIPVIIDRHLRYFLRKGGQVADFLTEMDRVKFWVTAPKFNAKQIDAFLCWIEKHDVKPPQGKQTRAVGQKKIQAPVIKLFCAIVHQSNVIVKGYDESPEKFITRVCEKFKIPSNPKKARQYFDADAQLKRTDKNLQKVVDLILPTLPQKEKIIIQAYINSRIKLYG